MNDSRIAPVFQILAEDIYALGVRTVFGLMSDDTAVFAVTLDGLGVKFVGARHENNAIAMAEGYAYATGELGVAVIGRGPATANGLRAAVAASRMGSRVLVIYGDAAVRGGAVNGIGPDYKGFNAQAVLGAAGLTCFTAASPRRPRARPWPTLWPPPVMERWRRCSCPLTSRWRTWRSGSRPRRGSSRPASRRPRASSPSTPPRRS